MNVSSVSTYNLATAMLPGIQQSQSQLATLEIESSTGQYADLGLQLGANTGYEMSLRAQDDSLQAMTTANGLTQINLSTSQSALTTLQTNATSTAQSLVAYTTTGDNSAATLQTIGQNQLQQLTALGNTSDAQGDYVFGGQNTSVAPLNDYYASPTSSAKTALDNAFQNYFGFSTTSWQTADITSTQLQGFLTGPMASLYQPPQWQLNSSNRLEHECLHANFAGNLYRHFDQHGRPGVSAIGAGVHDAERVRQYRPQPERAADFGLDSHHHHQCGGDRTRGSTGDARRGAVSGHATPTTR